MNIAVYCGSSLGNDIRFAQAAREFGQWIGTAGHSLVYGGSAVGIMGIISENVMAAGGNVYGVEPRFFIEAGVAQQDLTELFIVETMSERKAKMIELADCFVALPGGVGTLEEISEILSCIRLGLNIGECFFLNIDGFYDPLDNQLEAMVQQGFLDQSDLERYHFLATVNELICSIEHAGKAPALVCITASELKRS